MLHKIIIFIHKLRIYLFAFIVLGFFVVAGLNPIDIGSYVGAGFGKAVGMSVAIPENPFNKLALDLKNKENILNERELALSEKEKDLQSQASTNNNLSIVLMAGGIVVLFFLVLLNYYLDWKRKKSK